MTDVAQSSSMHPDALAHPVDKRIPCDNCQGLFAPVTKWQRFCEDTCRRAFHRKSSDGGLRGVISKVGILRRGVVSVVLRFGIEDRERAQKLTPGTVLEVVESE